MSLRLLVSFLQLCAFSVVAGQSSAPRALDKETFDAVRGLIKESRFEQATALLEPFTESADSSPMPLYLLALVRLQEGRFADVQSLVDRLRLRPTSESTGYVERLTPLLQSGRRNLELHADFAAALRNLDGARAATILGRMDLPTEQRAVAGIYLDAYRGRITTALGRLNSPEVQPLPRPVRDALRAELKLSTGRFQDLTEQLRWYTDSSLAASSCQPADARERSAASGLVLAEYVRLTELALQLFPFNDAFMDSAFHGALLSASYEDLQRLGDDILNAKGALRIPFYSSTARIWLVIDNRSRRLSLELDPKEPRNLHGSEQLGEHVLFSHPYGDVTRLSQRASNVVSSGSLARDSYAVKLSPRGQAPHFLFMSLVHCLYGEETQKQITRNLGRFIQHALAGSARLDAELEDASRVTRDRLQLFSQIVGTSTVAVAGAAEQMRRAPDVNDGRISLTENLQQTAREGEALMTRRSSLLNAQATVRDAQRASSRTWSESLADSALGHGAMLASARVDDLLALIEVR